MAKRKTRAKKAFKTILESLFVHQNRQISSNRAWFLDNSSKNLKKQPSKAAEKAFCFTWNILEKRITQGLRKTFNQPESRSWSQTYCAPLRFCFLQDLFYGFEPRFVLLQLFFVRFRVFFTKCFTWNIRFMSNNRCQSSQWAQKRGIPNVFL